jgi:hypothetical protein
VCNGSNCSETPLTTVVPVVAATEHDVPATGYACFIQLYQCSTA